MSHPARPDTAVEPSAGATTTDPSPASTPPSDLTLAWLRLATAPGIGPVSGRQIAAACGGAAAVWQMTASELHAIDGITERTIKALGAATPAAAEATLERCARSGIRTLNIDDTDYPAWLRVADDAPLVLYALGEVAALAQPRMLAVVGARKADSEGKLIARRWCAQLAERGIGIVSGMAYGIDAAAHGGALDGKGYTVAVLGCGLATPFSPVQQRQIEAITEKGCVLSESLPTEAARPDSFPRRNRIIAGLCQGTLVVQADIKSGSLITARLAADYGREVLAVPGSPLNGRHAGCHQLIRDGATLVESPDDILHAMRWRDAARASRETFVSNDPRETEIMQLLAENSMHIDALAEGCGLTVPELSPILLGLELRGAVDSLPGSRYALGRGS